MRLLQRPRQRRQSHAHTDNLVVGVFYHTEQVEAQQAQINLHIIVNLTVGQFGKLKQLGISLVDKVEERTSHLADNLLAVGVFLHVQPIFLLHYLGDALMLLRDSVGHGHLKFHPVGAFFKSHALHVLGIVWVVVDGSHRRQFIEALNKHSLIVHIGKSERTNNRFHSALLAPCYGSVEKRVAHFLIIDKLHKSETHLLLASLLV